MNSSTTLNDILTQTDAWRDALQAVVAKQADLQRLWQAGRYEQVIFTGCGSTHYLSLAAASLLQAKLHLAARATPASELLLHPDNIYLPHKKTLLVAISRSGATTETVQAANECVTQGRGDVWVVSCYDDKPLNEPAALTLAAKQGQEVSIAQTRSFSSMLIMVEQMTRVLAGEPINADLFAHADQHLIEKVRDFANPFTDPARYQRYFYLGSGANYGLASEAMLKMKEISLTNAEMFHPMEFRHGPKSMVDAETVVVGLFGERGYAAELAVLKEMQAIGATILNLSAMPEADYRLSSQSLVDVMPVIQWLAYQRAINKGLDPDRPRNLEQVVHLEANHF